MTKVKSSMRGQLLLDGGQLGGSFFHRTVVLICQHDDSGALGVVLNRPTSHRLGEVVLDALPEWLEASELFVGGPVQPAAVTYLYVPEATGSESEMDPMVFSGDLAGLGSGFPTLRPAGFLRIFAGYAGWAPGQLESELDRGAWLVEPASRRWLCWAPTSTLWSAILRNRSDWRERLLAATPEDPSAN
jgi:putative transcriptional regulator